VRSQNKGARNDQSDFSNALWGEFMRSTYEARVAEQTEIQRTLVQGTARLCRGNFGKAWKGIFAVKAAEELAARTGCSVRAAAYELSGEREPSAKSIAALVTLIAGA
jgi:hypothetical protein